MGWFWAESMAQVVEYFPCNVKTQGQSAESTQRNCHSNSYHNPRTREVEMVGSQGLTGSQKSLVLSERWVRDRETLPQIPKDSP